MPGAWERRPTQSDLAANGQQQHYGRLTAHKEPAAARRVSGGNTALHRPRENAPSNQQSSSTGRRRPQQQVYDAFLLQSFDAAVAAAGDSHSSWLTCGQDLGAAGGDRAGEGHEARPAPTSEPAWPASGGATPPPPASAGSPDSPGTGLLLPHLRSAGVEGTSWLTSTSPTHSECLSSPSLAVSCSLSLSLGSPALNTNGSKPLPPLPPGSPVTLQPLPQGRLVSAAAARAVGQAGSGAAWWSPGAARAQQQEQQQGEVHDELARANQEERQQEMPLEHEKQLLADAGPLVAGDPGPADSAAPEAAAAAGSGDAGPSSAERPSAATSSGSGQRRCRSPFLARDCSCVDVWTPDRYARWVGEQLGPGGEEPGGRRRCSPPGDSSPAPAGSAGFRWRDYVDAVEAAQMGVSWDQAGTGSREGGGGMGLRGALKSVLGWVAGRLGPSHPIELTPSELGSYGSAHSSPVGTPYSGSPDVAGGSHSRYFTPASEGPGSGGTALHVAGAGRREGSSAGLRWRLGEAAEESPADGDSTAAAGGAAGAWRGARTLSYGGSEGGSGGGSSAGSCSCSPNHEDDEGHAVQGSADRRARRGSVSSRDSTNSAVAAAAAAAAPPPPAHDRGHLAAVRAPLQQLRCSSGGTSSSRGYDGRPDQQQLRNHDGAKPAQCSGTGGKDWAALAPVDQGTATGAGGGLLAAEDSDDRLYHTPPCCSPQKVPAAAAAASL